MTRSGSHTLNVMATRSASAPLTFDLPISLIARIESHRRKFGLKTASVGGATVLTSAKGFTLYWFAPDTATASHCTSTCAAYWPPVLGSASTNAKVVGTFSTVKRSNGALQVTYDGHPLYTYVGDSAPGQASGNDIKLNGGFWYEMKVSK